MQDFLDRNEGLKFLNVSFDYKSARGTDGPIKESNISSEEDLEEHNSITNNSPIKEQIKDYNRSSAAYVESLPVCYPQKRSYSKVL